MKKSYTLSLVFLFLFINAYGQQVLFSQNFNSFSGYPIPGWTTLNNSNSLVQWECGTPTSIGALCFQDLSASNTTKIVGITDVYMVNTPATSTCTGNNNLSNFFIYSPSFSLSAQTHATLQFDAFFQKETVNGLSEGAYAEVSTDNGINWTRIYALTGDAAGFHTHYADLTAFCGQSSVRIGFRYSDSGQRRKGLMLDNIRVFVPGSGDLKLNAIYPNEKLLSYVAINQSTYLKGLAFNNSASTITAFDAYYTHNGGPARVHSITGISILPFTGYTFTHSIPDTVMAAGTHNIKMWVVAAGDTVHTNDTLNTKLYGAAFIPEKKLVIEEGTGTWSMYGPRGIAYFDSLKNDDTVCKISVHNTDVMADSAYAKYLFYLNYNYVPYFLFDRHWNVPYQNFFANIPLWKKHFGFASIEATGTITGNQLIVNTSIVPAVDMSGDIRVVMTVTENNVTGTGSAYNQVNAYTGGVDGPMGGFETKPNPVLASDMTYNYIARGIYPNPEGSAGIYSPMTAGNNYAQAFTATLNPAWNYSKLKVTIMLIDYTDTTVLNAQTCVPHPLGVPNMVAGAGNIAVYPNPSAGNALLSYELSSPEMLNITVTDISGRLMWQSENKSVAGKNAITLPAGQLGSGIYFVTLQGPHSRQSVKWQVVK